MEAISKIEKLIDHGRKTVWNPEHDVDWSAGGAELEALSGEERDALCSVLSLVYYSDAQGREILKSLCRSLDRDGRSAELLPIQPKVHEFFEQQMEDEDRHANGLRLLFSRLGLEPEPKAFSHVFYSKFLFADGLFDAKLILIYWYIEILAKGIFAELKARFPQTCVDSLFTRIIRDEARHVGFGEIYIPVHAAHSAKTGVGQMAVAYYSSALALPSLYRFSHYARAARVLKLDVSKMFSTGMAEVSAKAEKLPSGSGFVDLKKPASWISLFL